MLLLQQFQLDFEIRILLVHVKKHLPFLLGFILAKLADPMLHYAVEEFRFREKRAVMRNRTEPVPEHAQR